MINYFKILRMLVNSSAISLLVAAEHLATNLIKFIGIQHYSVRMVKIYIAQSL